MITHIDKEIYINAYNEFNKDPINNSRDFIDFIKKGSDVKLYGFTNDISNDYKNILTTILEGRGDSSIKHIKKSLTEIVYNNCEGINNHSPYQLLFLNTSEKQNIIKSKCSFETGFINNYQKVYDDLSLKNKNNLRKSCKNCEENIQFKSWEHLFSGIKATNMIISDPYLLSSTKDNPLKYNYFKLINFLSKNYNLQSLFIFTNKPQNIYSGYTEINEFNDIKKETENIMKDTFVKIILFQKNKEHDRHIFTDYCRILFGSSLNFFYDKNDNISNEKNSFSISFHSYIQGGSQNNFNDSKNILYSIEQYLINYNKKFNKNIYCKLFNFNKIQFQ